MWMVLWLCLLVSCDYGDWREATAARQKNQKGEYIARKEGERLPIPSMKRNALPTYSWDRPLLGQLAPITQEHFRCKGYNLNTPHQLKEGTELVTIYDCMGSQRHSLPLREGKEWIYPALIEVVNYAQTHSGKPLVITSGHRCPDHNRYVDPAPGNQTSKHQIGACVNCYLRGMESEPYTLLALFFSYYKNHPIFGGDKAFTTFIHKPEQPYCWYNKELFIQLYPAYEGRNGDNRHPYPYFALSVRWDRERNERVVYSWQQAFGNFLRY